MASVRLEKLDKYYGDVHAIKGIDLEIADGECVAFLGPSGCGKSSTMRCIAGLEEIAGGKIFFDDRCVNRVQPSDRGVAMAFETYALYPTLNVYENLAFPLRAAKWDDSAIDEHVRHVADVLEITELLERFPRGLSSGQAQRTGLARALIRKPEVFLLDEPISHLDTRQRARMRAYLKRLHIELGHTMIYVTHDQEEAMALADRITIMKDGRLMQTGTPYEVYHRPANKFVAGFIGEPAMNFLDCRLAVKDQQASLEVATAPDIRIPLPPQLNLPTQTEESAQDVTLGIRPYYINIAGQKDEVHIIPATVFIVEPLGDSTVVTLNVADTQMQAVTPPEFRADSGQAIWLSFDLDRIHLFDAATEKALT